MKALRAVGTNTCALAKRYGLSRQVMSLSLRQGNTRCEARIAAALGLHPATIWPSRYHPDGQPKARPLVFKPVPEQFSAACGARKGSLPAASGDLEKAA